MQFELSAHDLDSLVLSAALRPLDPAAKIALDAARGRLEVISSASAADIQSRIHTEIQRWKAVAAKTGNYAN